jgi:hypothetical protein
MSSTDVRLPVIVPIASLVVSGGLAVLQCVGPRKPVTVGFWYKDD